MTITGSNLGAVSTVTFGGAALENMIVGPGQITGNAPPGAVGSVAVTVTSPSGSATVPGGFTYVPVAPVAGSALSFSGNDSVWFGNTTGVVQNTMEAWVRPQWGGSGVQSAVTLTTGANQPCGQGMLLVANPSGVCYDVDPTGCGTSNFNCVSGTFLGTWTHLAGTFDGSTTRLYVNGTLVQTLPVPEPPCGSHPCIPLSSYLLFGDYPFCCGVHAYYAGELDEVRIWNYSRSAQQIRASMNRRTSGTEPGLVGYWRLDDGSGTSVTPTGVGVVGNFSGSPTWVTSTAPIFTTVCGQANSATASLTVNGVGGAPACGPFALNLAPGTLTLTWNGPPGAPLMLLAGPRNPGGASFPCSGITEIGTPPAFSDVTIIANGLQPGFPNLLFVLDGAGFAQQTFSVPPGLTPGTQVNLQGLVVQPGAVPCPSVLTGAFYLTF